MNYIRTRPAIRGTGPSNGGRDDENCDASSLRAEWASMALAHSGRGLKSSSDRGRRQAPGFAREAYRQGNGR